MERKMPAPFIVLLSTLVLVMGILLLTIIISMLPIAMLFGVFFFTAEWLVTKIFGPIVSGITSQLLSSKLEESNEAQPGRWG